MCAVEPHAGQLCLRGDGEPRPRPSMHLPRVQGTEGSLHVLHRPAVCSPCANVYLLSVDLAVIIISGLEGGNRNLSKLIRPPGGSVSGTRGEAVFLVFPIRTQRHRGSGPPRLPQRALAGPRDPCGLFLGQTTGHEQA